FRYFGQNQNLSSNLKIMAGVEYIPDVNGKWLKKMAYRAGAAWEQMNIILDNYQLSQVAVTAGIGIPFLRTASRVNLGFEYAFRGKTDNGLIKEDFFRVRIGINFNDRWFIKRKFG
ncbi:MAG: hypothetical protein NZ108_09140, partial [Bacteroidia bacterium]|nr:hypothetical protein [Bacteroidia bacterium]